MIQRFVLTPANIRNNYIRVRQFNGLISQNRETTGSEIIIELDGVGSVRTTVDQKKGILAERHAIKEFFHKHHLNSGDEIGIEKVDAEHFKIKAGVEMTTNTSGSNIIVSPIKNKDESSEHNRLPLFAPKTNPRSTQKFSRGRNIRRANDLDGKEWTANSISVWKDIRKGSDEKTLEHPAMFPLMLVRRVIRCFTTSEDKKILDPFMGSGSTLVGAALLGRTGIGFEIYREFIELAEQRLYACTRGKSQEKPYTIYPADARRMAEFIHPDSIDLCFTSPPYWNILSRARTADYKETRDYGNAETDLSQIEKYNDFITSLGQIFTEVLRALKPGKYCIVNVMDLRKGSEFFPFHVDLATEMQRIGYLFDDIIIWDRSLEYNNLRPLGYPAVFRINKVHEYLLIFQKPHKKR
jgi:DNA modification methylase